MPGKRSDLKRRCAERHRAISRSVGQERPGKRRRSPVKRVGSYFPPLEIGHLIESTADVLADLDNAPLQDKLEQIKAIPKESLDTLLPNGNTLLHRAVLHHDLTFAEALLQAGAKVDSKNESGQTPLSLADISRNQGMILLLVYHGADMRPVDPQLLPTLLRYALSKEVPRMVDDLLAAGAHMTPGEEDFAVRMLINRNRRDILEIVVKHGFSIPDYCERCRNRNLAAFIDVEYDMLQYLLEHGAPPNQVDNGSGYTPLIFNAREGFVEDVELLIDFRADVNAHFEGRSILSDLLQREWIESEQIEIA